MDSEDTIQPTVGFGHFIWIRELRLKEQKLLLSLSLESSSESWLTLCMRCLVPWPPTPPVHSAPFSLQPVSPE